MLVVPLHRSEFVQELQEITIKILKALYQKVDYYLVCVIKDLLAPLTLEKYNKYGLVGITSVVYFLLLHRARS